jgi:hypothetical protein
MRVCKLCQERQAIRRSHIIPSFVTKWILDTSVTRKIRGNLNANKRVQSSPTVPLLCKECEALFSGFEKYFSEQIFKPVIESYNPTVLYDERLLKFCVSLSWRWLVVSLPRLISERPDQEFAAAAAEKNWRELLLKGVDRSGYEHHLLMLRRVSGAPKIGETDLDINWYFFRASGWHIRLEFEKPFILIKLPAFLVVSPLSPGVFAYMSGTRIHKVGRFEFLKQKPSGKLIAILLENAEEALTPLGNISQRQKDKINADYEKNKDKIVDSYGFKVYWANEEDKRKRKEGLNSRPTDPSRGG